MESFKRYRLFDLVKMIEEPNSARCFLMWDIHYYRMRDAHGSTHNHQNWKGGYFDHIIEVMNRAVILYRNNPRVFPFSLSSALLVLFLHDIEKPWKYEPGPDGELKVRDEFNTEEKSHDFRNRMINEFEIVLTDDEENALKYVHGEGNDYSSKQRVMGPLAAFCHICDVWVARIDYDCPMRTGDSWAGVIRSQM